MTAQFHNYPLPQKLKDHNNSKLRVYLIISIIILHCCGVGEWAAGQHSVTSDQESLQKTLLLKQYVQL